MRLNTVKTLLIVLLTTGTPWHNAAAQAPAPCSGNLTQALAAPASGGWGFGRAVAVWGDYAAVGGQSFVDPVYAPAHYGSTSIYEWNAGSWSLASIVTSNLPIAVHEDDEFGLSLDGSGNFLIVGARRFHALPSMPQAFTGAAFVYERLASGWALAKLLRSIDIAPGDEFGKSVSIDGEVVAVGAPGKQNGGSTAPGAVYIFRRTMGVWLQEAKLTSTDNHAVAAGFGQSVNLSGGRLAVGAPYHMNFSGQSVGNVHVFENSSGASWALTAKIELSSAGTGLGRQLELNGDQLLVASSGPTYLFQKVSGFWALAWTFPTSGPDAGIAFTPGRVAVGDPTLSISASNQGGIRLYEYDEGVWAQTSTLYNPGGITNQKLGVTVSMYGERVIAAQQANGTLPSPKGECYVFSTAHQSSSAYGIGCSGSGGLVPTISLPQNAEGCFKPGAAIQILIEKALGPSQAVLFVGTAPTQIPVGGACMLLVPGSSIVTSVPLFGSGVGNGNILLTTSIPSMAPLGSVYVQAFVLDAGAPTGFAATNGIRVTVN